MNFQSKTPQTILLLLSCLLVSVSSNCSFTIKCDDENDIKTCKPLNVDQVTSIPVQRDHAYYNNTFICPDYYLTQPNCCNNMQNKQMLDNFAKVDATFGELAGGCDFCGANLKRFWCEYTCSPYQSNFVFIGPEFIPVPDPLSPDGKILAQNVTIFVDSEAACDLFGACQLTPYVTQVTAMGSPAGFLAFQGANAVVSADQFMSIKFRFNSTGNNSINFEDFHTCNENIDEVTHPDPNNSTIRLDKYGFQIRGNCSCNTCAESCELFDYVPPGYMQGFDYKIVFWVYGFLVVLSIAAVLVRIQKKQQKSESFLQSQEIQYE